MTVKIKHLDPPSEIECRYHSDGAGKILPISSFRARAKISVHGIEYLSYVRICRECESKISSKYNKNHPEQTKIRRKKYYKLNKERENKNNKIYVKNRKKKDIAFKLRRDMSSIIYAILNRNDGSKKGKSIMNFLPYSIEELKQHLENQFESWI